MLPTRNKNQYRIGLNKAAQIIKIAVLAKGKLGIATP
ncbi:MAG: hypothetical protein ACJARI_004368 [Bacteroidia bacterium]|jgi:hypothetical protein